MANQSGFFYSLNLLLLYLFNSLKLKTINDGNSSYSKAPDLNSTIRKEKKFLQWILPARPCSPVFPAAFTRVCTEQTQQPDELSLYNDLGATVFGISVDMPFSLKEYKEKNKINFELLSDANKLTIHEYDMYHCNFICGIKGVAKRGVIVIGADGLIAYAEETVNTGTQVNFAALKEALAKLK
jgi:peroxiredoxin